jgi:nucleotide-binding universal stress UspA family protein
MYQHILVPTDGTALSLKAAKAAARLAKQSHAKITAIYAIEPYAPPSGGDGIAFSVAYTAEEYEKGMRQFADKALAKVRAAAKAEEVDCPAISVVQSRPWEAIVNAAKQKKCDLIVMASHGRRGFAGLLLGSETNKVLTHSKTPVLVCR